MFFTFKSVDKILKFDRSIESCWAVIYCGAVYYAVLRAGAYIGDMNGVRGKDAHK